MGPAVEQAFSCGCVAHLYALFAVRHGGANIVGWQLIRSAKLAVSQLYPVAFSDKQLSLYSYNIYSTVVDKFKFILAPIKTENEVLHFVKPYFTFGNQTSLKYTISFYMPYNEKLTARVREALTHLPNVEEKKMFGGLAFMVDGKMCITVGKDRIMCRIDPALHEEAIKDKRVRTVKMGGCEYKGYIHINQEAIKTKNELTYWIEHTLRFNKIAKASKK